MGERAIDAALERAGLQRRDLDALYVVSVTGVASPSLDARLINRMGLRPDIKRTPIFGVGCVGGAIGLTRAADYVLAYPKQVAVILSVELCSLTIQRDDLSTVNMISMGLFADGAVAAILAGAERSSAGPTIVSNRSVFYPDTRNNGLGHLRKRLRHCAFESATRTDQAASRRGCRCIPGVERPDRSEIKSWVIHPGGPKILQAVESALGLCHRELALSWECLAEFGNLSSGSVLKVLEAAMTTPRPEPGAPGLILAMGPGFCSEMMLVKW